jgi:hypothetical protein
MQTLRWLGAFTMTVAVTLHTLNIYPWNVYVQMLGAVIWIYAGTSQKDWALVSNFVPQLVIMTIGMSYLIYTGVGYGN